MKDSKRHTPGPWKTTKGTNGFCDTWQVAFESATRACTIADCGAIVNQVYQGTTESKNFKGEQVNLEHEAVTLNADTYPDSDGFRVCQGRIDRAKEMIDKAIGGGK